LATNRDYTHQVVRSQNSLATLPTATIKPITRQAISNRTTFVFGTELGTHQENISALFSGQKIQEQAGYGLIHMLVSSKGTPKQKSQVGEHKSILTDRVILISWTTQRGGVRSRDLPHVH
jgi:hypothetical protein